MIGGSKTEAGKDRVIPIHKCVLPLIEKRLQYTDYLVGMANGKQMQYRYYLEYVWKKVMQTLDIEDLSPHCCRHTFITLATASEIDERKLKMIVGHSTGGDITDRYRHSHIADLIEAIDKITL